MKICKKNHTQQRVVRQRPMRRIQEIVVLIWLYVLTGTKNYTNEILSKVSFRLSITQILRMVGGYKREYNRPWKCHAKGTDYKIINNAFSCFCIYRHPVMVHRIHCFSTTFTFRLAECILRYGYCQFYIHFLGVTCICNYVSRGHTSGLELLVCQCRAYRTAYSILVIHWIWEYGWSFLKYI